MKSVANSCHVEVSGLFVEDQIFLMFLQIKKSPIKDTVEHIKPDICLSPICDVETKFDQMK